MSGHHRWSEIKHKSETPVSVLETQDNGVCQILIDCPRARDNGSPGYLILVKDECTGCPFHKGVLKEGPEGFDISAKVFENIVADEIYSPKHLVMCAYKNGGGEGAY